MHHGRLLRSRTRTASPGRWAGPGFVADNAMAESFFATLKTEFYHRRAWPTHTAARLAVGAWIEDRYNRRRRHSALGQISPVQFEMQHCNHTAAVQQAA